MSWITNVVSVVRDHVGLGEEPAPDLEKSPQVREVPEPRTRTSTDGPRHIPASKTPDDATQPDPEPAEMDASEAAPNASALLPSPTVDGTHPCLDVTRAVCVCCACLDLGGAAYSNWNVLTCKAWVVQYSFIVAGICYAISDRPLVHYVGRLLFYLGMGIFCNWLALNIAGADPTNIMCAVHHLWFLAAVAVFAVAFAPLKQRLRKVRDDAAAGTLSTVFQGIDISRSSAALCAAIDSCFTPALAAAQRLPKTFPYKEAVGDTLFQLRERFRAAQSDPAAAMERQGVSPELPVACAALIALWCVLRIVYCMAVVPCLGRLLAPPLATAWPTSAWSGALSLDDEDEARDFEEVAEDMVVDSLMRVFSSLSSVVLAVVFPALSTELPAVAWLMIVNSYGLRLMQFEVPWGLELVLDSLDTFVLGLVCYHYGLMHRRLIGEYVIRYWPVFLFVVSAICPTGPLLGRGDTHPVRAAHSHAGVVAAEMLLVVFYLSAMERMVDPKIFSTDKLHIIRSATLPVFLFFEATWLTCPWPFSWTLLGALVGATMGKKLDKERIRQQSMVHLSEGAKMATVLWSHVLQLRDLADMVKKTDWNSIAQLARDFIKQAY